MRAVAACDTEVDALTRAQSAAPAELTARLAAAADQEPDPAPYCEPTTADEVDMAEPEPAPAATSVAAGSGAADKVRKGAGGKPFPSRRRRSGGDSARKSAPPEFNGQVASFDLFGEM